MTRFKLHIWFADQPTISNSKFYRSDCVKCAVQRMANRQQVMASNLNVAPERIKWTVSVSTGHLAEYKVIHTSSDYPRGWARYHAC